MKASEFVEQAKYGIHLMIGTPEGEAPFHVCDSWQTIQQMIPQDLDGELIDSFHWYTTTPTTITIPDFNQSWRLIYCELVDATINDAIEELVVYDL